MPGLRAQMLICARHTEKTTKYVLEEKKGPLTASSDPLKKSTFYCNYLYVTY